MARGYGKRPPRSRSCSGKKKLTKSDAIAMVNALRRKRGAVRMKAYRCHYRCKLEDGTVAWHVGHTQIRKR